MDTSAELASELYVWLQIAHLEEKKLAGVGSDVYDLAVKNVKRLTEQAKAQGI